MKMEKFNLEKYYDKLFSNEKFNLKKYYDELFTYEKLVKYGYYSYKTNKKLVEEEDYFNSDVFYHKLFNLDDLFDKIKISKLNTQTDLWTEPTYFNIPKVDIFRREFKLPNLYSYIKLVKYMVNKKSVFKKEFLSNIHSTSKYFDHPNLTFDKQKEIEVPLLYGGNKLLKTDLTNFYPTLYTHSIPWIMIGKWQSKKLFKITKIHLKIN